MTDPESLQPEEAARHWRRLAMNERRMAQFIVDHDRYDIGHPSSYHARAATYDRTATALELEAKTGRLHCSICFGDHPNHLHNAEALS